MMAFSAQTQHIEKKTEKVEPANNENSHTTQVYTMELNHRDEINGKAST